MQGKLVSNIEKASGTRALFNRMIWYTSNPTGKTRHLSQLLRLRSLPLIRQMVPLQSDDS